MPSLTYTSFMKRMRDSKLKGVSSFVLELIRDVREGEADRDDEDLRDTIRTAIERVTRSLRSHVTYAENGEQKDERFWNDTREHLEKFVTTRVYKRIFGVDSRDADRDEILERRSAEFDGNPQDLHVESKDIEKWNRAAALLRRVDSYRAPRDKLIVIVNCVRMMNEILAGNGGADRLVPAMIYVTLKANPTRFASNLKYVRHYRDEKMMRGEEKYALVVAESAVRYLLNEEEEEEEEEEESNLLGPDFNVEEDDDEEEFVCTFRNVKSAGDLRLEDVPKLLNEYKRLCMLLEKRLSKTSSNSSNSSSSGDGGGGGGGNNNNNNSGDDDLMMMDLLS